jgi:CelD/BcsL family acetyltransferase involved in cellulose biosynthesis
MGYDPDYGKYSPGMYLIMKVIEGFCGASGEKEISGIDFGLGDAQYKQILGNVQWQDASAYIFAPTLRGLGLNALRTPIIAVDRAGRRALERMKLLPKVKKLWRQRAAPKARRQGAGGLEPIGQPARREEQGRAPVSAE